MLTLFLKPMKILQRENCKFVDFNDPAPVWRLSCEERLRISTNDLYCQKLELLIYIIAADMLWTCFGFACMSRKRNRCFRNITVVREKTWLFSKISQQDGMVVSWYHVLILLSELIILQSDDESLNLLNCSEKSASRSTHWPDCADVPHKLSTNCCTANLHHRYTFLHLS